MTPRVRKSAAPAVPNLAERLECRLLFATAALVRDLNAISGDARISVPVNGGALSYFAADDGVHGRELWKTDGSAGGTTLVADIRPGPDNALDGPIAVLNGTALFTANDGTSGMEVWRSGGTLAGTERLVDAFPGAESGGYRTGGFAVIGNYAYFRAQTSGTTEALYRTDGTRVGTSVVQTLNSSTSASATLTRVGSSLFYVEAPGQAGLWTSDGTPGGTHVVTSRLQLRGAIADLGGTAIFPAVDLSTQRVGLWRSDGTDAGTVPILPLFGFPDFNSSMPGVFCVYRGQLYFGGVGPAGALRESQLWRTDGTPGGTVQLTTDLPHFYGIGSLAVYGEQIYFLGDYDTSSPQLWRYDPASGRSERLSTPPFGSADRDSFVVSSGKLFYLDYSALMVVATPGGMPQKVSTEVEFAGFPAAVNGGVLFSGYVTGERHELYRSDGTPQGTYKLKDVNPTTESSQLQNLTRVGDVAYFTASDGVHPTTLYRTDGTPDGTRAVLDPTANPFSGTIGQLTAVGSRLFFTAGGTLWTSDGTSTGTVALTSAQVAPAGLAALGDVLYFAGSNPSNGVELWRSDGTPSGTTRVQDINPGAGSSAPYRLTAMGGVLYFSANDGVHGFELWRSDGTAAGTSLVRDISAGSSSGMATTQPMQVLGNALVFDAYDASAGVEVWRSDGTAAGTYRLKDVRPGNVSSQTIGFRTLGNRVFFTSNDGTHGFELWATDGTAAGTALVKDIFGGSSDSFPVALGAIGNVGYFYARGGSSGGELYRSDGTAAGTTLVKDINPGSGSSAGYSFFTVVGSVAYFDAADGSTGDELWSTNGTSAGTTRVQDLSAGAAGSSPAGGVALPSGLLFSADTPQFGRELWKLPAATPPAATVVGRHVYYNASGFDHGRRRAEPDDDVAVATDKAALLPGGRATFANYTSYRRGINGIMVDIANLPTGVPLTAADFTFKVGNNNTTSGWAPAPLPREVTLRWGAGENGSARVSVTWADGAILNKWLQVTVLANPRTGLAKPDVVFYFGNRVGDTGTAAAATTATVDALDLAATRRSLYSTGVTVTSRFDFDRDGRVTLTDLVLARRGAATRLALSLISPPAA